MDPLRWTSYLDDCLRELEEQPEWPGDEVLVHLVRMQLVIEKATLLDWYETCLDLEQPSRTPPTFYVQSLLAQLQRVWAGLPPRLHGNGQ